MSNMKSAKDFYKEQAEELYRQSDKAHEDFKAVLDEYGKTCEDGEEVSDYEFLNMIKHMKIMHDSLETHRRAVLSERKAKELE